MINFLTILFENQYQFLLYAIMGGLLSSISLGITGTYVVTRRITSLTGAVAHCVLGGIGAALYAERVWGWKYCDPVYGAIASALLATFILHSISKSINEREDTLITALWSIGMAIGLILISETPGFIDPMIYLFGNILFLSQEDLTVISILDIITIAFTIIFYNPLIAICFDEENIKIRGIPTFFIYSLLLILTSLTIVLLIKIVGIVLVIGLLTIPPAIAGHLSKKLWHMMATAIFICMLCISLGLYISYEKNLPSGPTIGLTAAGLYVITTIIRYSIHKILKYKLILTTSKKA